MSFLFEDFQGVTSETWRRKIQSDLKTVSINDCYKELDSNLYLESFASKDNLVLESYQPLLKSGNSSLCSVRFDANDLSDKELNEIIISSLESGLEAIDLELNETSDIENIYRGVIPNYVYNGVNLKTVKQYKAFSRLIQSASAPCYGFLGLDPEIQLDPSDQIFNDFHRYKIEENQTKGLVNSLLEMISDLVHHLEAGVDPRMICMILKCDDRTLRNIIKLRTLRMIWSNILNHYDKNDVPAFIVSKANRHLNTIEKDFQLIAAGNIALSMVLGGTDVLSLFSHQNDTELARLSINISHLLKYEAKLDQLHDPLSGCYAIEKACLDLAEAVWKEV